MRAVREPIPPSVTDPFLGVVLGDEFTITAKLGEGGMGSVYRAVQRLTERDVAIKVLHRQLYDATLFQRFLQEAKIISRLNHPNIVTIYKYGQHADSTLYIAMEYVEGSAVNAAVAEAQQFDVERALPLMIQMADALAYAHEQKIIHRDIKPENMLVTRTGRSESIKLVDFGIAKMMDGNTHLTQKGMMCGSPAFMSPEQWNQVKDLDGRTDMYSLGCVFYEMMTGKLPHKAETNMGYMKAHTTATPTPPIEVSRSLSNLPVLNDIILRCMKSDRMDRYPDAYALLDALRDAQIQFEAQRRRSDWSSIPSYPKPSSAPGGPLLVATFSAPASGVASGLAFDKTVPSGAELLMAIPEPRGRTSSQPPAAEIEQARIPPSELAPDPGIGPAYSAQEETHPRPLTRADEPPPDRVHMTLVVVGALLCAGLAFAAIFLR